MEKLFREVSRLIADKNFAALQQLKIPKPEKFNWVKEIFEGIYVKDTPDATALLWTDGKETHRFSFKNQSIKSE